MPSYKKTLHYFLLLAIFYFSVVPLASAQAKWKYFRSGHGEDSLAEPRAGFALMGGGAKLDAAYKFLCERANGGDFLILRADTEDDYAKRVNDEILTVCPLNSASTIVFAGRDDSDDPKVAEIIAQAEAIFFAGGDQSNYVRFWQDTPVQIALNRHVAAGKPIGGSSAGLAILGEFSFTSMIDTIHSPEALGNPYGNKITLSRDFLRIPLLTGIITDTHFVKRDRMGRLLVFMARVLQDGWASRVRAIAVEENAAVLFEPDGTASVVGEGPAYFLEANKAPAVCAYGKPLTFSGVTVHKVVPGKTFHLSKWDNGETYTLSITNGMIRGAPLPHAIY
jgi:cyanophycinase